MIKINYVLGYENLKIYQDSDWFNFSLDSILLPNFVRVKPTVHKILDIGSGNAIIPIILSKKFSCSITGVEIQKEIYNLGLKSIELNQLENCISFINDDIKEFARKMESDVYDVITCNPPYFKIGDNSSINCSVEKSIARHEISLNLETLLSVSRKLLKNGGSLYLVHRPERFLEIVDEMRKNNIEPKRVKLVYPRKEKDANILLIEGIKNGKAGLIFEDPLYVYDDNNQYTEEIMKYFS